MHGQRKRIGKTNRAEKIILYATLAKNVQVLAIFKRVKESNIILLNALLITF